MSKPQPPIRTGYFGGSFNPIHEGYIRLAEYLRDAGLVDEVWFVVSPQNPLKATADPDDAKKRLNEVRKALADHPGLLASDFECTMPIPSYTADCLRVATARFPNREFILIIGGDNLDVFTQWKDYPYLLEHHDILVYPRPGATNRVPDEWKHVKLFDAPLMDISSTQVRRSRGLD